MENNQTKKKAKRTDLILLVFVLISMGLIFIEIFGNLFTHLLQS